MQLATVPSYYDILNNFIKLNPALLDSSFKFMLAEEMVCGVWLVLDKDFSHVYRLGPAWQSCKTSATQVYRGFRVQRPAPAIRASKLTAEKLTTCGRS